LKYLLDTNVISELRKRKPHGAVIAWMHSIPDDSLLLPAVVIGELQIGVERTRAQDPGKAAELDAWVNTLSAGLEIVAMDGACFREWARLMQGTPGELLLDAMIAAIARVHNLTVATRNVRDFESFGVRVFNPFASK
jgi:predicted nucleic acid-binding protein